MARPKKAPHEQRSRQVNVRMTLAELLELETLAAGLGITPADFIRRRSFGYSLPRRPDAQEALLKAVAVLAATGNNLNQLTRHAHAGRLPHADRLATVLDEIEAQQERIFLMLDRFDDPRGHEARPQL
ncbi:plasmid mobilization protein [Methylobacterium sp. E-046]|uniref:plasmid mobilization protein n=1 Tax=Methylobacterium sp. E-046 TaxID=2836576 RepID=UPI001FB9ED50|nr:plasmid mobilization relaxosome protein MobC [Methylobacterium sp. E-046]MCJ2097471.1 MobC family plasmid mobilization relaxosome protein [Methylobacterium sp. E-046]